MMLSKEGNLEKSIPLISNLPVQIFNRILHLLLSGVLLIFSQTSLSGQEKSNQPSIRFDGTNPAIQAIDAPHWGNQIDCLSCHVTHESADAQLTNVAGNANLCMSCHNPVGVAAAKPFVAADKANPGISGTSHAWDVSAENIDRGASEPANPEMARRLVDGKIICSTCHNQHKQAFQPFLRASNADCNMCKDCHAVRNIGSYRDDANNKGSHPVDVQKSIDCSNCHVAHFAYASPTKPEGDGYLLRVANDDNLCMDCHNTFGPHMGMGCRKCHKPHDPEKQNILLVKGHIWTPNSGQKSVRFYSENGAFSFADGDQTYDGICEICHTQTDHFRNDGTAPTQNHENFDGGEAGANCTNCHPHKDAFLHGAGGTGCIECHGHDKDYEYEPGKFSMGAGTVQSHSTHTENDGDDLKGPNIACDGCHDTANFPSLKSGTDSDGDGKISISETDVCNACHSPNGSFNGVSDATIGAKNNWQDGVYTGFALQSGKEKWCAGCHDQSAAVIETVYAPNIIGDNSSYGFYKTGHGLSASRSYPGTGDHGAAKECLDCHTAEIDHIDGNPKSYYPPVGYETDQPASAAYQNGFRLKNVSSGYAGKYPMHIPRTGHVFPPGFREEWEFALCFSCHSSADLFNGGDSTGANAGTYFRNNSGSGWYSSHDLHTDGRNGPWGPTTPQYDSDFNGTADSRISCPACHNVHGSPSPAMIRHGELIGKTPGLQFQYLPENTYPLRANSTGGKTRFIAPGAGTVAKNGICNMCHNDEESYRRTAEGGDWTAPEITQAEAQLGSDILRVTFSEPVYSDINATQGLLSSDFSFTDNDNGRTITAVNHAAGATEATLTLSAAIDASDDIGTDELLAATATSIYDSANNAMLVLPTVISGDTTAGPAVVHPTDVASNTGACETDGGPWSTALDDNDGAASYVKKCCGAWGSEFFVAMDDPTAPVGASVKDIKIHVFARYMNGPWPNPTPIAGEMIIGYNTGGTPLGEGSQSIAAVADFQHFTSAVYTTNPDGAPLSQTDIENLEVGIRRNSSGPQELQVTEIYVEINYQ